MNEQAATPITRAEIEELVADLRRAFAQTIELALADLACGRAADAREFLETVLQSQRGAPQGVTVQ
jgi:Tfp pilus assembly protein PilF